jgi:hypothetical protein
MESANSQQPEDFTFKNSTSFENTENHARKRGRQSQAAETKGTGQRGPDARAKSRTHVLTHSLPAANVLEQKAQAKDYTDEDKAHLQKKKEEAAALKAARDALLKGKKK